MTNGIHWFRNDLRLRDQPALAALGERVSNWLPVFVLDPKLHDRDRAALPRTRFYLDCLHRLQGELDKRGVPLIVRKGDPEKVLPRLMKELDAEVLSFNSDPSPFAVRRDDAVRARVEALGGEVIEVAARTIFGADEIRKQDGGLYSVYSPYRKAWWKAWNESPREPLLGTRLPPAIEGHEAGELPAIVSDESVELPTGGEPAALRRLDRFIDDGLARYHHERDVPAVDGTSRLSPYLRVGAISPRECFARVESAARVDRRLREGADKWLDEIIWREFYASILERHPRVMKESFKPEYDRVEWNDDPEGFAAWCEGRTGFPIVDAGMRQLNQTGWMHNRVRMIVASFLTKDLLIDWREGERYFFDRLIDADPASNNGGWQWAASTGTDAQPYFRIFNPITQGERWDPDGEYIRRFVPELRNVLSKQIHEPWGELGAQDYPERIVDHAERRELALARFKAARQEGPDA